MVAISMATLRPGAMGGSETYARSLVTALAARGMLEYVCLVPRAAPEAANGLRAVPVSGLRGPAPARLAALLAGALRGRALRRLLPGLRAVHYPFTLPVPPLGVPAAVTLHDLLHRELPALWPRSLRAFRAVGYDRAARRAALVIVPSEYVRTRVVAVLGVDPERVRAIPHGIDHTRFRPGPDERQPFVLYPARRWPHKNHARLLEAFTLVRRERPELTLLLTGWDGNARVPEGVQTRGVVPQDELASLYRRAAALVFPSLHEGFGQPPLEAMACGCPVACSGATSLPEVCGDAAVYFDPTSADDIAGGVLRALADADELAARGVARASAFSWERSAVAHEEAYRRLLDVDER
jgi:glycosyltransferase involved in cell wall biosynthesis